MITCVSGQLQAQLCSMCEREKQVKQDKQAARRQLGQGTGKESRENKQCKYSESGSKDGPFISAAAVIIVVQVPLIIIHQVTLHATHARLVIDRAPCVRDSAAEATAHTKHARLCQQLVAHRLSSRATSRLAW